MENGFWQETADGQKKVGSDNPPWVVFRLDDQRYGLRLDRVRRSIRVVAVVPLPEAPAIVLGVIDLAGEVLAVIDLRQRFGHPHREIRLTDQLLIAWTGRRTVALLVDETLGVIDAAPESYTPVDDTVPGVGFIEGTLRCEDGLVLIHDLGRLLSLDEEAAVDHALEVLNP